MKVYNLSKNEHFKSDKEFMEIVNSKMKEYNDWCEEERMPECKISINNILIKEILFLFDQTRTFFKVYVEDTDERILCIVGLNIFDLKWETFC